MHKRGFLLLTGVRLLSISILSAVLIVLRYILKTPQPLESMLSGEARLFRWTHGHIFYKVLGASDTPPLVLLHTPAIGGSSYEFLALAEQLAQHYCVYALDLLGFGLSDRPSIYYTGETYTALCQDFLTQVVQRPAILVASGLSCNYAIAVASTQPSLCECLVLLSPCTFFAEKHWTSRRLSVFQRPFVGLFVYAFLVMPGILRTILTRQKHVSESELRYIYASAHQLGAQYPVIALLAGQLLLDTSSYSETLKTPTLLVLGTTSSSIDESVVDLYATNDAVQEVLIQGAGLWPHQEQPAEVVAQILQWCMSMTLSSRLKDITVSSSTSLSNASTNGVEAEEQTQDTPVDVHSDTGLEMVRYTKEDENVVTEENSMQGEQVEAYCVKCKEKRIMQDPTDVVTKNGRNAKTGICPVCGTKLFRFVAS